MMLRVLRNRLIVERIKPETTKNVLYLPADDVVSTGIVKSVGRLVEDIKVGDKVLYGTYDGDSIEVDGEKLTVLTDCEVLAVIED